MRNIYFVLTYTGTFLSKIIKIYTRKRYSHVSIALDKNLHEMYSFGRLNPYNPFIGGFVKEGVQEGTFKRFKNTDALVVRFKVTDEQYDKIVMEINKFMAEKEKYKFNILGLFLTVINKRIRRRYYFYCAEFIKYVMEKSDIDINLPTIIRPEDFIHISNVEPVYKGKLRNLKRIRVLELA